MAFLPMIFLMQQLNIKRQIRSKINMKISLSHDFIKLGIGFFVKIWGYYFISCSSEPDFSIEKT